MASRFVRMARSGQVRRALTFRVAQEVYRLRLGAEHHPDDFVPILFRLSITHLVRWQWTVIPRKHWAWRAREDGLLKKTIIPL